MLCAYISVEQVSEEHNKEELNRRVDPNVPSCHCRIAVTQVKLLSITPRTCLVFMLCSNV
jgi:hypothetical protein